MDTGGIREDAAEYANVPPLIAIIVTSKLATLYELQTVYGVKDAYDFMEIILVNNANSHVEDPEV